MLLTPHEQEEPVPTSRSCGPMPNGCATTARSSSSRCASSPTPARSRTGSPRSSGRAGHDGPAPVRTAPRTSQSTQARQGNACAGHSRGRWCCGRPAPQATAGTGFTSCTPAAVRSGGDELAVSVDVGVGAAGGAQRRRDAGATRSRRGGGVAGALDGVGPGGGGHPCWAPEPTVLSDGAVLESTMRVELAADATAQVGEIVVLSRHGQRGGRCTSGAGGRRRRPAATRCTRPRSTAPTRVCAARRAPRVHAPSARSSAPDPTSRRPAGGQGRPPGCAGHGRSWTVRAVLLAVGTPAAVTAVLDAADGVAFRRIGPRAWCGRRPDHAHAPFDARSPDELTVSGQAYWMPPYTWSKGSVSITRRSVTIAARYSVQFGCSPASVR